jgi:hypothetical protein
LRALRDHDDVGVELLAAGERRRDVVAVVGEVRDLLAETVVGVLTRAVVEDAGQLPAQDLHLGGTAVGVVLAGGELGDAPAVVAEEAQPHLARPRRQELSRHRG